MQRSLEGCDRWGEGRGVLNFEASVVQWKDIRPGGPSTGQKGSILFLDYFSILGDAAKLRWTGGRGAQRPVWGGNELKKTGARSARARTRGQNPLVYTGCGR